jgi:hypothetical protein
VAALRGVGIGTALGRAGPEAAPVPSPGRAARGRNQRRRLLPVPSLRRAARGGLGRRQRGYGSGSGDRARRRAAGSAPAAVLERELRRRAAGVGDGGSFRTVTAARGQNPRRPQCWGGIGGGAVQAAGLARRKRSARVASNPAIRLPGQPTLALLAIQLSIE